jgi:predicted dehydrogenase
MTIKVAIVGAGYMAREHIKAFRDIPEVFLSGISSRTLGKSKDVGEAFGIANIFDDIDDLCRHTQPDLVVVAVPELALNDVLDTLFKYSITCLIEKPIGYNLKQSRQIYSESLNGKAKCFVGLNRRFYASTKAVELDLQKYSSYPRLVHIFDQENPSTALASGRPPLVCQNWMYANSVHIIDYLSLFCRGDLVKINNIIHWDSKNPFFVLAQLQYSSGDIGIYQAVWEGPGPWAVTVTTPARRWEMRPLEQAFHQDYNSRQMTLLPSHEWDQNFKPGLRLQAEEAIKAVKGEPHNLVSLEDNLKTMNLINLIYGV